MKFLRFFFLVPFIACANAKETNVKQFTLDSKYAVQATCEKGIKLNLLKSGKTVFSLRPEDGACGEGEGYDASISFDENLYGSGKKGVRIAPAQIMTTTSETIYVVDTINTKIIMAGSLPIIAEYQGDGTILHEALDAYSKFRVVYQFLDNKIIQLKATSLYFNGNICIQKSNHSDIYNSVSASCSDGIVATQDSPVCVSRIKQNPPEIIPLEKCEIKKEDVSTLQDSYQ